MRHLPLGSLRGFEAAARLKSFTAAAEEFNLTQSAVSHQIRTLEDAIGAPLFVREHRTVRLTDAGFELWRTVRDSLSRLDQGIMRVRTYGKPSSLIVACDPALASRWLVPLLPAFRADHPAIDLWLYSTYERLDLDVEEVDIVIQRAHDEAYGAGRSYPIITGDFATPHCSPAIASSLTELADLPDETLLHDERDQDWPTWLSQMGPEGDGPTHGPSFSDPHHCLMTAEAGHGIALGSWLEARAARDTGMLTAPWPDCRLPLPDVVMSVDEPNTATMTEAFTSWLSDSIAGPE